MSPAQNMSVAPKSSTPPTPILPHWLTSSGTNFGYTAPSTPQNLTQGNFTPAVENKPFVDTKWILQINKDDPHVKQVLDHMQYLKSNGADIGLNDTQSAYIQRFKAANPEYQSVPDVNLFTKIIQKSPETLKKYGAPQDLRNVLEKVAQGWAKVVQDTYDKYAPQFQADVGDIASWNPIGIPHVAQDLVAGGLHAAAWIANNTVQSTLDTAHNDINVQGLGESLTGAMNAAMGLPDKASNEVAQYLQTYLPQWAQDTLARTLKSNPALAKEISRYADTGNSVMEVMPYVWLLEWLKPEAVRPVMDAIKAQADKAPPTDPSWPSIPSFKDHVDQTKNIDKNTQVLSGVKLWVKWNTLLDNAESRGFNPVKDVATYWELKPEIDSDGKINTDQAVENLEKHTDSMAQTVHDLIEKEWAIVSLEDFKNQAMKEIESQKSDITGYDNYVRDVNQAMESAKRLADDNGNIPLTVVDDIKKTMYNKIKEAGKKNFLSPTESADKAIARAAKTLIEDNTKSADIKSLNNELSRWYTTREYLNILWSGTKVIKWGRLWKYFATLAGRGIGAAMWSILWVPWELAGWFVGGETASYLHGKMLENSLKDTTGKIPESDLFNKARQTLNESTAWNADKYQQASGKSLPKENLSLSNDTKNQILVNPTAWELLAHEIQSGKIAIKEAIKEIWDIPQEEIAKHPELQSLQMTKHIVDIAKPELLDYGRLTPDMEETIIEHLRDRTPEEKQYIFDSVKGRKYNLEDRVHEINIQKSDLFPKMEDDFVKDSKSPSKSLSLSAKSEVKTKA